MKTLFLSLAILAQFTGNAQTIEPAPADKSVVYFVCTDNIIPLFNFTYFDNDKVIGNFEGLKYMRYVCEPGEHIFWAKAENRDFIKANLLAGEVYIVEVIPFPGKINARVKLCPVNDSDYNLYSVKMLMSLKQSILFRESELEAWTLEFRNVIRRGLKKATKLESEMETLEGYSF